jgi:hypothetical protein
MTERKGQATRQKVEVKKQKREGQRRKEEGPGQAWRRKMVTIRELPRRRRLPGVPPAESEIWPEQYRGERWKPVYGILFRGKCQLCAYSSELPKSRRILDRLHGQSRLVLCTNHPTSPGELREMLPTETCRNFKAKRWHSLNRKRVRDIPAPTGDGSDPSVRRIPLGKGLFATVDATDYEKVSRYKWLAQRDGRCTYATCRTRGRAVSMHRMIMRPRKGYVVDHIDGNGLNNRRCNLRECTIRQNRANTRPCGGSSRFVGVYRHSSGKWVAALVCRGKYYYLGIFEDEVEAAKARDRKAYEFFGEYAYLNFPEDFRR